MQETDSEFVGQREELTLLHKRTQAAEEATKALVAAMQKLGAAQGELADTMTASTADPHLAP